MTNRAEGSAPNAGVAARLTAKLTRRDVAKAGGLLTLGALGAHVALLRSAAQDSPQIRDAINAAITVEAFAVTFYGAARGRGERIGLSTEVARFVRAAQCEEEAHYHFFEAAGAVPSATTFSISTGAIRNQEAFLPALLEIETLLVGAHMAAARRFATGGDPRLVEVAYQIGAVEAQHQTMTRVFLGERLPTDRAFAKWLFRDPAEAVQALTDLRYIGGGSRAYDYPGPVDRYCRGVFGLVPETTDDQPAPTPVPAASPQASPEASPEGGPAASPAASAVA